MFGERAQFGALSSMDLISLADMEWRWMTWNIVERPVKLRGAS